MDKREELILISSYSVWSKKAAKIGLASREVIDLLDIEAYFRLLGAPLPKGQQIVLDILEDQGLILGIVGSGWTITNLAAILLAKELKAFSFSLSTKAARFIIYEGNNKLKTKYEVINDRGYASSFDDFLGLINTHTPQKEKIKKTIRALVGNALVHQDFFATGNRVMIEVYTDRIEVSHPGKETRNQQIADLMKRFNIDHSIEEDNILIPKIRVNENLTTAMLEFNPTKCWEKQSKE